MKHEAFEDLIAVSLSGGLADEEMAAFEAHRAGCPACASSLAAAEEFERTAFAALAPYRAPAELEDRVARGVGVASKARRWPRPSVPGWLVKSFASAAAACVMVLVGAAATEPGGGLRQGGAVATAFSDDVRATLLATSGVERTQLGIANGADNGKMQYWGMAVDDGTTNESVNGRVDDLTRLGAATNPSFLVEADQDGLAVDLAGAPDLKWAHNWVGKSGDVHKTPHDATGKWAEIISTLDGPYRREKDGDAKGNSVELYALFDGAMAQARGGQSPINTNTATRAQLLDLSEDGSASWSFRGQDKLAAEGEALALGDGYVRLNVPVNVDKLAAAAGGPRAEESLALGERLKELQKDLPAPAIVFAPPEPATTGEAAGFGGRSGTRTGGRRTAVSAGGAAPPKPQDPAPADRKIVRTGTLTIEVASYDAAFKRAEEIASALGGYVADAGRDTLPNGKVRGTLTVRVPADKFSDAVERLRGLGDLKNQSVLANDVSKHYFDLQGRVTNSRVLEERLRKLIAEGKGEVKDLLEVEKELAKVSGQIEQMLGEIKFYDQQVSMSAITLTLAEKDIEQPAEYVETQGAIVRVIAPDIDKAVADAKAAVAEATGQVIEAQVNRGDDGSATAVLKARIVAEKFRDVFEKLKALGVVEVGTIDQRQSASGPGAPDSAAKVRREAGVVELTISAPKEIERATATLTIEAASVADAFAAARQAVLDAGGELTDAKLDRQGENAVGTVAAKLKIEAFDAVLANIEKLGSAIGRTVNRNEMGLTTPSGRKIPAREMGRIALTITAPQDELRATATLAIEASDVGAAYEKARAIMAAASGKQIRAGSKEGAAGDEAFVEFTVDTAKFDGVVGQLDALGKKVKRDIVRLEGRPGPEVVRRREIGKVTLALVEPPKVETSGLGVTMRQSLGGLLWSVEKLVVGAAYSVVWIALLAVAWFTVRRRRKAAAAKPA